MGRENEKSKHPIGTKDVCTLTENPDKDEIRVAGQTVIPTRSESSVLFVSTMVGVRLIESKPLPRGKEQVIFARGAAKILSLIPFYVLAKNLSAKPAHLVKKTVIARGIESPTRREQFNGSSEPTNKKR